MSTPPPARRCLAWRLRTRTLSFTHLPAVMGIVNITPDSFSDGGQFLSRGQAIDHALRLEDQGADLLDLGGESTRPYSDRVAVEEELRRVVPVLEGLQGRVAIPLSIDTTKSRLAAAAIDLGCEIINDISGLTADPQMLQVAAETQAGVCAMHMQGTPQTMQDAPAYDDVVGEIYTYLAQRQAALLAAGIDAARICLDPGIGFGKTHEHNFQLIAACSRFLELGAPLLVGHSRKGFIAKLIGDKQRDRTAGTLGTSLGLARQGVQVLRVHDVAATRDGLLCFAAAGGLSQQN